MKKLIAGPNDTYICDECVEVCSEIIEEELDYDDRSVFDEINLLTPEEINGEYEKNTGLVIIETFKERGINPVYVPAVLCTNHGPFTWGKDAHEAVHNAVVLEEVAKMAYRAETINPRIQPAPQELQDKHYYRKHGVNAYYGQN